MTYPSKFLNVQVKVADGERVATTYVGLSIADNGAMIKSPSAGSIVIAVTLSKFYRYSERTRNPCLKLAHEQHRLHGMS